MQVLWTSLKAAETAFLKVFVLRASQLGLWNCLPPL